MKNDAEVRRLLSERNKGARLEVAAARAGMTPKTARKYVNGGKLPSELKQPRAHRTRLDPFALDWDWVKAEVKRDDKLQAKTLFDALCESHPDRYQPGQVRTLQRRIEQWRALSGPERTLMFQQSHVPGKAAQSDFTEMKALGVTLAGVPFDHLCYHLVLTYSNQEAVTVCFSETFESLAEGIETALWRLGGVPEEHRTDNLSAAVRRIDHGDKKDFTTQYQGLMDHYGMRPTSNTAGESHQNGDVEQSHHRFKIAVDQALRLRGSRDFESREAYEAFLQQLVAKRNRLCRQRFEEERPCLKPLPAQVLAPCKELLVRVTSYGTARILHNTYSVPSRLVGEQLKVRLRAERIELFLGAVPVGILPRLRGRNGHNIDYRHVIWSLVRKPGAFAAWRFREEMFPSLTFRRAYDQLVKRRPARADAQYLKILHLAASQSEADVEVALALLLEAELVPDFEAVRDLADRPVVVAIPDWLPPPIDMRPYDALIASRRSHHA